MAGINFYNRDLCQTNDYIPGYLPVSGYMRGLNLHLMAVSPGELNMFVRHVTFHSRGSVYVVMMRFL
jgi:hypothetical protein